MTARLPFLRAAFRSALAAALLLATALPLACGPGDVEPAAVTTLDPPPGPFNGSLELTFTTDKAATIHVTTDGSDPRDADSTRITGESPLTVTLDANAVVSFFSVTAKGTEESLRSVQYIRAGGPKGTVTGAVVVGSLALGHPVALQYGTSLLELGTLDEPGELPFELAGLPSGNHRFVAIADDDGDGAYSTFTDFSSDAVRIPLDLDDPFEASAENVRIYIGASPPDLGTLQGTVHVPNATGAENLSISALSGNAFSGGADPSALLSQLTNGYRLFTRSGVEDYPYVITDLEPGIYIPVPLLTSFSGAGIGLNFVAKPMGIKPIGPGDVSIQNFAFGPVRLAGTVTLNLAGTTPSPVPEEDWDGGSFDGGSADGGTDDLDGGGFDGGAVDGDDLDGGDLDGGDVDGGEWDGGDPEPDGGEPDAGVPDDTDGGTDDGDGGNGGSDGEPGEDEPGFEMPDLVYGVVAARNVKLDIFSGGVEVQAVIMPVVFLPGDDGKMSGRYLGRGLRSGARFEVKVFTSLDPENPATAALAWLMQFDFGGGPPKNPPDAIVTMDSDEVDYDFEFER